MAYLLIAEKDGCDLEALHKELSRIGFDLIEYFPIVSAAESPSLGICIPLKNAEHPDFPSRLTEVLTHLIVAWGFTVTDLYTGEAVSAAQIENLPRVIAS